MSAAFKICRKRTACAVLAFGVVISLTALTGGVAPAFAKPGDEPVIPTTTIVAPEPELAPTPKDQPAERPTQAAEVPAVIAPPPVPVAPVQVAPAPVAPSSVEAPPQPRALQPVPSVEAPSRTRAPEPLPAVTNSPATSAAPSATREIPLAPTTRATVTPSTQSPSSEAPSSQSAPTSTPAAASAAPSSSNGSTPPSPALVAPTPGAGETPADSTGPITPTSPASPSSESLSSQPAKSGAAETSASASTPAVSSTPAAERVIDKVAPQTLVAPEQDVQLAKSAKIVEEKPDAAPKRDIDEISNVIDVKNVDRDRRNQNGQRDNDRVRLAGDRDWDRNVRQWRPDWVEYDEYYRPVLSNPYRNPVRIVYIYQNAPRIVFIPPLARIVLEVAQFAAYSFTALVTNPINQAVNVAVGSFFGGGYYPGFGQPFPPPPPPLLNYANVPVQVRYPDANYQPFRVSKIIDVGDDAQYGERKVLLDGVTPAWGQWTQTPSGERSFEVHKTQQFPGLDDPRPGPLPGDYQLTLASDESSSGMTNRDVYLIAVAVVCGVLSIGAVVISVLLGRRRRPQH